jgi:hypothetical protein
MAMKFEILTAAKMSMLVFCVVTLYGLVGVYQRFGETLFPSSGLKS